MFHAVFRDIAVGTDGGIEIRAIAAGDNVFSPVVFDALQVSAGYILRAYKITLVPTAIYAVMLWGVGLGGGYVLGFDLPGLAPQLPAGAAGFWLGNTASVLLAAVFLLWHLRSAQNRMR